MGYPQENKTVAQIFLAPGQRICEPEFTAADLRESGGAQGPSEQAQISERLTLDCDLSMFVGQGRRAGRDLRATFCKVLERGFGCVVTGNRNGTGLNALMGERFRKASGCAAKHDAKTASEHLAPFPFRANGARTCPSEPTQRQS